MDLENYSVEGLEDFIMHHYSAKEVDDLIMRLIMRLPEQEDEG